MSIKRGEVYWVSFDPSIGGEIQKTRPAVVVSNDVANDVLNRLTVVPLSSRVHRVYPAQALVELDGKESKAMADQLTTVSKLRLRARIGGLSDRDLARVESAILFHLSLGGKESR